MLATRKLTLGHSLKQLRQAWVDVGQTARSKITGAIRPELPPDDYHLVRRRIDACLLGTGGTVSAHSRAVELGRVYLDLNLEGRRNFIRLLATDYGVDTVELRNVVDDWTQLSSNPDLESDRLNAEELIRKTLRSPRIRLLTQFNDLPEGIKFLVDMRSELRSMKGKDPHLNAFDREFKSLLESWFDIGFLKLRRITWDAPAALLESLANYEAVHPIRSWRDIKHRLAASDRHCYAFIHPQMPNEPLIFVWVALTHGIPNNVQNLLSVQGAEVDLGEADTAVFYSISATQSGLDGVGLGNFLIKRVVDRLSRDYKQIKVYSTLSPIPGFARWLQGLATTQGNNNSAVADAIATISDRDDLSRIFTNRSWIRDTAAVEQAREPLMLLCAHYLLETKRGISALDPVANFHLSNGASIERLNWMADTSKNGQQQSVGLMVNYRYRLKDIESNHEAYHTDGKIICTKAVSGLLK